MRGDIIEIDDDGNVTKVTPAAEQQSGGVFENAWRFFFADRKPYNDNGQEYNAATGFWEWTAEASEGHEARGQYHAPEDYQGSVPVSDGSW